MRFGFAIASIFLATVDEGRCADAKDAGARESENECDRAQT
jgi:hypothetical protein